MALRFLLGAAEAGVYPGMIFYLSFWYGPRERAIRIAIFLCSATLAGAFGGVYTVLPFNGSVLVPIGNYVLIHACLSGAIAYGVGHMNHVGGLEAWRWLFILEGLPCIILAVAMIFFLPSYPEKAEWLTDEEKDILRASFHENIPRG